MPSSAHTNQVNEGAVRLRILVVADDPVDRALVQRLLVRGGIDAELTEAGDAAGLMQKLSCASFDCLIVDYGLPDAVVTELLPELQTWTEKPPVVVLTNVPDETVAVEVMQAGAVDYIAKTVLTPERLARSVAYGVALWRAERAARQAEAAREGYLAKLAALARVTPLIQATLTVDKLAHTAAQCTRAITSASHVFVGVERGGTADAVTARANDEASAPPIAEPPWLAAWDRVRCQQKPLRASPEQHPELLAEHPSRVRSLLAVPVVDAEGAQLGVIEVADTRPSLFTETDSVILSQFGRTLGAALQVASLYRAANEATQARDEVLAIVSHDLRSPLGAVVLAASALREVEPTPVVLALADRLERSVRHMQRLIADLLDASRIDSQRLEVATRDERPAELIETAISLVAPLIDAAHVRLVTRVDPALPCVSADRERIAQVVTNLVGNAIKYSELNGEIELRAELVDSRVVFTIRDTGRGIPPEHLPRLFDRFWRPKDARGHGVGLGLYIAKGIIDAHSSCLEVESEVGVGTTFRFGLPLAEPAASCPRPEDAAVGA
jgi:signal transduction histidine kinase